jgi:hypothetical protein
MKRINSPKEIDSRLDQRERGVRIRDAPDGVPLLLELRPFITVEA